MDLRKHRSDDCAAVDAMLNEGGHLLTGNLRRGAVVACDVSRELGPQAATAPHLPRSIGEDHV